MICKYFYHMAVIFLWTLAYYLFHSYFNNYSRVFYIASLCLCSRFRCLGLAQWLQVQFRGIFSSSTEPSALNHASFVYEHEVMLDLARFHPNLYNENFEIYFLCLLANNGCVKHVKESYHNTSTEFCSYSLIVIQLIYNVCSSFSKVI